MCRGYGSEAPSRRRMKVLGQSPQPPQARGLGGGAPSARKFCCFFWQRLSNIRPILIKINAVETWL